MHTKIRDSVVDILGIKDLPVEHQEEVYSKLGTIVYTEAISKALDFLSEEDQSKLDEIIEKNPDPENIITFLAERVPELDSIVQNEAEKLKAEVATIMNQIGN
jgi:hypothetical protein